jgi:hypothetical protein
VSSSSEWQGTSCHELRPVQLPAQIHNGPVALFQLFPHQFEFMSGIAQLFFERARIA